jgi:hypothetical protein
MISPYHGSLGNVALWFSTGKNNANISIIVNISTTVSQKSG